MKGILNSYPHLADWLEGRGHIELGTNDYSASFIRVLDEGGLIWEGRQRYASLEEALAEAERALVKWLQGQDV